MQQYTVQMANVLSRFIHLVHVALESYNLAMRD